MNLNRTIVWLWAMALGLAVGCGKRAPQAEDVQSDAKSNLVVVGAIQVDASTQTLTATGWVNQVQGLIELLACGPGGKTHESVLVLDLDPADLQAALLLLGLKPGGGLTGVGEGKPFGAAVEIWIDWTHEKCEHSVRAEECVWNVETHAVLPRTPWTFTGSVIEDGVFRARTEQSFVATYWDPWAILNLPLPCGSDDEILVVNTDVVPPLGTSVRVRMRPEADEAVERAD